MLVRAAEAHPMGQLDSTELTPTLVVRTPEGQPIPEFNVSAAASRGSGEFAFEINHVASEASPETQPAWIEARAPGLAPAGCLLHARLDEEPIVLELRPLRQAVVRVHDPLGRPLEGVTVRAVPFPSVESLGDAWGLRGVTNSSGEVVLGELGSATAYRVIATPVGGGVQPLGRAADVLPAGADSLDVVLSPARVIWCRPIVEGQGAVVGTATWRLLERTDRMSAPAHRSTGDRPALGLPAEFIPGDFELVLTDAGNDGEERPYGVARVTAPGFEALTLPVSSVAIERALRHGPQLVPLRPVEPLGSLLIVAPSATPALGLPVSVASVDDPGIRASQVLRIGREAGSISLALPAGRYRLAVVGVPYGVPVDVTAGQATSVEIPADAWRMVRIRVRPQVGAPPDAVAIMYTYSVVSGPQVVRDEPYVPLDTDGRSPYLVLPRSGQVLVSIRTLDSGGVGGGKIAMDEIEAGAQEVDIEVAQP